MRERVFVFVFLVEIVFNWIDLVLGKAIVFLKEEVECFGVFKV